MAAPRSIVARASARDVAASIALAAVALSGCGSPKRTAPIEDRTPVLVQPPPATVAAVPPPAIAASAPLPGAENAGKPGYYTVKPGDTLIRIGLEAGQSWRDIVRWNNLENPNLIEVGQVLRTVPPGLDPTVAVVARPVAPVRVDARPLGGAGTPPGVVASAPPAASMPSQGSALAPPTPAFNAASASSAGASSPARTADDDVAWQWPAAGAVVASFDENRTKGLSIAGHAGDPVYAAADGRVVYAGSGLRGYGNLVIVKHNATYLTAYAHNSALLVKEDQAVRRGQKIAEMGSSDADDVELHFEIRKLGKPIDPARLLPAR